MTNRGQPLRRVLAALLAILAAGCDTGGDDTVTEPAAPAVPADAQGFLVVADERCARTYVELDAVAYPADGALPDVAAPFREVAAINREQLEDLRSITPPAGDEQMVAALLDTAAAGVDALDELVTAAGADDPDGYERALARIAEIAQLTADQAEAYGLATCFSPPVG